MFWIYGGALQFGNAGQTYYDGSSFAAYEDVIVVTSNYRTNVFGFATSPELPIAEQNLGEYIRGVMNDFGCPLLLLIHLVSRLP